MIKVKTEQLIERSVTVRIFSFALYGLISKESLFQICENDPSGGRKYKEIVKYLKLTTLYTDESFKKRFELSLQLEQFLVNEIKQNKFINFIDSYKTKFKTLMEKWLEKSIRESPLKSITTIRVSTSNVTLRDCIEADKRFHEEKGIPWDSNNKTNWKGIVNEFEDFSLSFFELLMFVINNTDLNYSAVPDWINKFLSEVLGDNFQPSFDTQLDERVPNLIDMSELPPPLQLFIECCNYTHLKKENIPHSGSKEYNKKLADAVSQYAKKYGVTHQAHNKPETEGISSNHAAALGFIINYKK